ncbi:ABC transporter ATP-binding protein [Cohnella sp. AR92]|nr:ABC transporter ATP-binding protein [Cohnella sp. AR92]
MTAVQAAEPAFEQPVLSVQGLKKRIRDKWIIKGVSFDIGAGEVFGFLGPNGAGKTTTIRMLVGLIKPTEGTIHVCGMDLTKRTNEALSQIGCIVENPELYGYLTGWENLEHFARMLPDVGPDRIREVTAIVGMDARIHDKVRTYSLGMRQRLGIAQALLGRPRLLILDEPTNGLDPQGIKEMREFIRQLAAGGLSVFVSSHLLSEIQLMCDRVAIISHGAVIAVGGVADLIRQETERVVWHVSPRQEAVQLLPARFPKAVRVLEEEGMSKQELAELAPDAWQGIATEMSAERIPDVTQALVQEGIRIFSVTIQNPTLEDLFLRVTEGKRIE